MEDRRYKEICDKITNYLDPDIFKAVVFFIDMTLGGTRKKQALKNAAKQYNVTQSSILGTIKLYDINVRYTAWEEAKHCKGLEIETARIVRERIDREGD